jgi:hypothetical protein
MAGKDTLRQWIWREKHFRRGRRTPIAHHHQTSNTISMTMTTRGRPLLSMLVLLATTPTAIIVSAFIPKLGHSQSVVASPRSGSVPLPEQKRTFGVSGSPSSGRRRGNSNTRIHMNYKSPDERNSYNDDAFGLVFLIGGLLSQDVDFVATFASLSAIAAIGTNARLVDKDERAPAVVAILTLLITPVTSSLRQYGSVEQIATPLPVEIGLCSISAMWAFVNWSRAK